MADPAFYIAEVVFGVNFLYKLSCNKESWPKSLKRSEHYILWYNYDNTTFYCVFFFTKGKSFVTLSQIFTSTIKMFL
jgi:hypothetical protein